MFEKANEIKIHDGDVEMTVDHEVPVFTPSPECTAEFIRMAGPYLRMTEDRGYVNMDELDHKISKLELDILVTTKTRALYSDLAEELSGEEREYMFSLSNQQHALRSKLETQLQECKDEKDSINNNITISNLLKLRKELSVTVDDVRLDTAKIRRLCDTYDEVVNANLGETEICTSDK